MQAYFVILMFCLVPTYFATPISLYTKINLYPLRGSLPIPTYKMNSRQWPMVFILKLSDFPKTSLREDFVKSPNKKSGTGPIDTAPHYFITGINNKYKKKFEEEMSEELLEKIFNSIYKKYLSEGFFVQPERWFNPRIQ